MQIRPFIGTLCGIAVGVVAIIIWMLTFEPHGGLELSRYLFPLSALILGRIYPAQSVPVTVWYGTAFVQWLLLGVLIDLLRTVRAAASVQKQNVATRAMKAFFGAISFVVGLFFLFLCLWAFTHYVFGSYRPSEHKEDLDTFVITTVFSTFVGALLIYCGLRLWPRSRTKSEPSSETRKG